MQVKRYVAATFAEALIQAKNELGTDAVIVESRKLKVGGFFGLFGREMTELTVAVDERPAPRPVQRSAPAVAPVAPVAVQPSAPVAQPRAPIQQVAATPAPAHSVVAPTPVQPAATHAAANQVVAPQWAPVQPSSLLQATAAAISAAHSAQPAASVPSPASAAAPLVAPSQQSAQVAPPLASGALNELHREMADLKVAVTRLVASRPDPSALLELKGAGLDLFDRMVEAGVEEEIALAIGRKLTEAGGEGRALVGSELAQILGPGAPVQVVPGERRIVALVGPTGVGKTTTLAKLAAHFSLERGLRVGLITSDTFRIAAVEQLRTYADILSIPVYAVERPEDALHALGEIGDVDLVLIDTGGRSHKDADRMTELRELLAAVQPDETHLVVSLNINPRDVYRMLDHYLPLGVNRFIFTKVDEASSPGLILNIQQHWSRPIAYVTHGQSVPDDLIPGDQLDHVKLILGA